MTEKIKDLFNEVWPGFLTFKEYSNKERETVNKEFSPNIIMNIIKQAYNLGIETAAKNVKLKEKGRFVASTGYSQYKTKQVINKQSILKLKIK